ncbi:MAG TPA: DNA-processing protein DprA [Chloroflexota bacterium]|nr:DNA-processing protein DprA [Chloroflexota bacterium]
MLDDRVFWALLTQVKGIGPARLRRLVDMFGDARSAWYADTRALVDAGLERRARSALIELRKRLDPVEQGNRIEAAGVNVVRVIDSAYPPLLRGIPDAPAVLFLKGELPREDDPTIAVVGTRRATAYGRQAAEKLAGELARAGVVIVSGLARGIDAVAHNAALAAGGRTLAVLGSGVDRIYPAEHKGLAQRVVGSGALVSEFPLGEPPDAPNFPRRNRIVAGLARGTLVIEADRESGALITVDFALEQGRDVYAVPGSIFSPASRGTNAMIKDGAKPVMSADDILEDLEMSAVTPVPPAATADTDEEAVVLALLSNDPMHIDDIGRLARLPMSILGGTLAMMELKGIARQMGGQYYVRTGI